jgi:hypothetical protein
MARPAAHAAASWDWAAEHVLALAEIWALVAGHSGFVGAWRLMAVCRAARSGAKEWLSSLPSMVVCGGRRGYREPEIMRHAETGRKWGKTGSPLPSESDDDGDRVTSHVLRLDMATLRWDDMPALRTATYTHACCTVRGGVVVISGEDDNFNLDPLSRVEVLPRGADAFANLPSLSCDGVEGGVEGAAALPVEESDSPAGQVLVLGGNITVSVLCGDHCGFTEATVYVYLVDLATGVCTPQPTPHYWRHNFAAARLQDGRVVCAGGEGDMGSRTSVEVLGPPASEAANASWKWTPLPQMSGSRYGCRGCVMSDGRFAVLGGTGYTGRELSSCEALTLGDGEHWQDLPPMHCRRSNFACVAVAGCIIVAGGLQSPTAEVYDEALHRWLRLPCNLPSALHDMGGVLL